MSCSVFFFQAEDGIRDLVRSRGLGDVYKRQDLISTFVRLFSCCHGRQLADREQPRANGTASGQTRRHVAAGRRAVPAVSYTHLTLPTSDLV